MTLARVAVVGFVTGFALAAGAAAKDRLARIPLEWRPTTPLSEFPTPDISRLAKVTVRVKPLADTRARPELIGENREDVEEGKILPVTTRDKAAEFCTRQLARLLERAGVNVTDTGGDVVVTGEVKSFFVSETDAYQGDVVLKIEVQDTAGAVLWSGNASGGVKRWGRSYKAENYYEVLSDSLLDAVFSLLNNPRFLAALEPRSGSQS